MVGHLGGKALIFWSMGRKERPQWGQGQGQGAVLCLKRSSRFALRKVFIPVCGISLVPLYFPWLMLLFRAYLTVWEGGLRVPCLRKQKGREGNLQECYRQKSFWPSEFTEQVNSVNVCVWTCEYVYSLKHIHVVHTMWEILKWITSLKESKTSPLYTLASSLVYWI